MGLSRVAVERMMKLQEVICRALAGTLSWLQAADILGDAAPQSAALAGAV